MLLYVVNKFFQNWFEARQKHEPEKRFIEIVCIPIQLH